MEAAMGGVQKGGKGGGRKGCPPDPQPADQKNPKLLEKKNKMKQKKAGKKKSFGLFFWGEGCRDKQLWFGAGEGARTAFRSVFFGSVFVLVVSSPCAGRCGVAGRGCGPAFLLPPPGLAPPGSGDRDSVRVTFDAVTPSTVRQPPSFLPAHPNKI